jgi:hypothetical protein
VQYIIYIYLQWICRRHCSASIVWVYSFINVRENRMCNQGTSTTSATSVENVSSQSYLSLYYIIKITTYVLNYPTSLGCVNIQSFPRRYYFLVGFRHLSTACTFEELFVVYIYRCSFKFLNWPNHNPSQVRGRRGRDRMVVRFTSTYAVSAYQHWCCQCESRS